MTDTHEQEITCPYNEAHRILKGRMATHLQRCRKQYDKEFGELHPKVKCPYDSRHRVYEVELEHHTLHNCDMKAQFMSNMIKGPPNNSSEGVSAQELQQQMMKLQMSKQTHIPKTESWDDEDEADKVYENKAAVVRQSALQKPIFSALNCEQPLDRKCFQASRKQVFRSQNNTGSGSDPAVKGYQPPTTATPVPQPDNAVMKDDVVRDTRPVGDGFVEVKKKVKAPSNMSSSVSVTLGMGSKVPSRNKNKPQPKQ